MRSAFLGLRCFTRRGAFSMAAALWGIGAAHAQFADPHGDLVPTPYGLRRAVPVQALPTPFTHGGSCVRWCVEDQTPCDPDYWKVADRRCNPNQSGGYH